MYMGRSESILTFFLCEKWASEKYKVEPTTLTLTAAAEVRWLVGWYYSLLTQDVLVVGGSFGTYSFSAAA